ncbi:MAG: hypothetical protein V4607_09665 [Pseudomonadota bacterium]
MLYKYRSLSNMEFALDIFVRKRLYAAEFKSLNDPMEGSYTYESGTLRQWQVDAIFSQKNQYRLTALSETETNMLMWSYYADSHSGMAVGVEINDSAAELVPIEYVRDLGLEHDHDDVAKRILSKKFRLWRHEREQRVFVRDRSFVKVRVHELIFGVAAKKDTKDLVTKIAKKFCPEISVRTLERDELDWEGTSE